MGETLIDSKFCGERKYKLVDGYPFLNLLQPLNPWSANFALELFTLDATKVGNYMATIEVKLVSYTMPSPLMMTVQLTILPVPINNLPYF